MYWTIKNTITGNTDSLAENYTSEEEALEVIAEWERFDKEHGEYIPDQYIAEPLGRAASFAEAIRVLASNRNAGTTAEIVFITVSPGTALFITFAPFLDRRTRRGVN